MLWHMRALRCSKNGAQLDGTALKPNKETTWPRGKRVLLGATELSYDDPVAEALAEIEAGSDEKMRDADNVDPPTGVPTSSIPSGVIAEGGSAPIARVPQAKPAVEKREVGFRTADIVIALLALAVLGASLIGLFWLSRMK